MDDMEHLAIPEVAAGRAAEYLKADGYDRNYDSHLSRSGPGSPAS